MAHARLVHEHELRLHAAPVELAHEVAPPCEQHAHPRTRRASLNIRSRVHLRHAPRRAQLGLMPLLRLGVVHPVHQDESKGNDVRTHHRELPVRLAGTVGEDVPVVEQRETRALLHTVGKQDHARRLVRGRVPLRLHHRTAVPETQSMGEHLFAAPADEQLMREVLRTHASTSTKRAAFASTTASNGGGPRSCAAIIRIRLHQHALDRHLPHQLPVVDSMVVEQRGAHAHKPVERGDVRQQPAAPREPMEEERRYAPRVGTAHRHHLAPALRAVQHHRATELCRDFQLRGERRALCRADRLFLQTVKADLPHARMGISRYFFSKRQECRFSELDRLPRMEAVEAELAVAEREKGGVAVAMVVGVGHHATFSGVKVKRNPPLAARSMKRRASGAMPGRMVVPAPMVAPLHMRVFKSVQFSF